MTWIETKDGFAVAQRKDGSIIYICLHKDCLKITWGCSNIGKMLEHLQFHQQGLWQKRNE